MERIKDMSRLISTSQQSESKGTWLKCDLTKRNKKHLKIVSQLILLCNICSYLQTHTHIHAYIRIYTYTCSQRHNKHMHIPHIYTHAFTYTQLYASSHTYTHIHRKREVGESKKRDWGMSERERDKCQQKKRQGDRGREDI